MLEIPPFHYHYYLHQAAIVESSIPPSYRLLLLLTLSRQFQLKNYVADCRRRSRLKNKRSKNTNRFSPPPLDYHHLARGKRTHLPNNCQKKYAAAKLKLAEHTASITTADGELEDRKKLIAKFLRHVGKHDENDIFSNVDSAESDSSSDDDDELSDDDSSTSTSDKEDDSTEYSNASDSSNGSV